MKTGGLEIRLIDASFKSALISLFQQIKDNGDDVFFHPHPFTVEHANKIANYNGKDLYYIMSDGEIIIGYAMLRGWDEGYDIPGLAIFISPPFRGSGFGKHFMTFLHMAAKRRGAKKIRLKVDKHNSIAFELYNQMGYTFESEKKNQWIGFKHV